MATETKRSLDTSLDCVRDIPNTISMAMMLRLQYNNYLEFSEPLPEEHWDFPHLVKAHIDKLYPGVNKTTSEVSTEEVNW